MKNILIVDDDLDIHELFKVEFKKANYKLFFAKNDLEAIEKVKNEYISVIFLDIILGTNQTSQNVIAQSNKTPVLLMSSHITDEYKSAILKKDSTIVDCIRKPFKKGEMLERVMTLLTGFELSEEDEQSTLVSADNVNQTEDTQLVSGNTDKDEAQQIIEGDNKDLGEGSCLVKGAPEDVDKSKEVIAGDREDLGEDSQLVKGSKDEEDKFKQVISGEEQEVEGSYTISSLEEDDENSHMELISLGDAHNVSKEDEKLKNDIQYLTNKGPKSRTLDGYTRLMVAVLLGEKHEVEAALDDGEALEDKCKGGFTCLHLAVIKNKLDIVDFLLEKGAKITAKDNGNREALFFAIQKNSFEMCKLLVEKDAPVNRRIKGRTYLILSALKKNQEMFTLFKNTGISAEVRDDHGFTVKHYLKKYKLEHFLKKSA